MPGQVGRSRQGLASLLERVTWLCFLRGLWSLWRLPPASYRLLGFLGKNVSRAFISGREVSTRHI